MFKYLFLLLILFSFSLQTKAQEIQTLEWEINNKIGADGKVLQNKVLNCNICVSTLELPIYRINEPYFTNTYPFVVLENLTFTTLDVDPITLGFELPSDFSVKREIGWIRKQAHLAVEVNPVRIRNGKVEVIKQFSLSYKSSNEAIPVYQKVQNANQRTSNTNSSVLASGNWYKIGITQTGVYKLDFATLQNLGINLNGIDPRNISIYGNGGGMLPQRNSDFRHDDLVENAIQVVGENDGTFNQGDFVVFYGEGPGKWELNQSTGKFEFKSNLYSNENYYFLNIGTVPGKRITNETPSTQNATYSTTTFDEVQQFEKDERNLMKSGKMWLGDIFDLQASHTYNFNIQNREVSDSIYYRIRVVARSLNAISSFSFTPAGGGTINSAAICSTRGSYESIYGCVGLSSGRYLNPNSNQSITAFYAKPNSFSLGWMDFIELNYRRKLIYDNNQFLFRDTRNIGAGEVTQYQFTFQNTPIIWNITNPLSPKNLNIGQPIGSYSFNYAADSLETFIAFSNSNLLLPNSSVAIPNQNLHAIRDKDLIIITHPDFLNQANNLANYHSSTKNLRTVVVTPGQIYNEFASGKQDVVALRDFVRMLYNNASTPEDMPRYLTLFGDASFDYKNRISVNHNFVPTFQSEESLNPINSYACDLFFGTLDPEEGDFESAYNQLVDIAIGRLPVSNVTQAEDMLRKIRNYESNSSFGDWRNAVVFVADDLDGNTHMSQADQISNIMNQQYPNAIAYKVFADAFPKISTTGEPRYPGVNATLNDRVNKGALIVNYTGHGGVLGWAEERICTNADINSWNNSFGLSLFITATCEFARFDDPTIFSSGEQVLMNPNGGAIAMMTTTRLTFSGPNFTLNRFLYENRLFKKVNGKYPTIGEAFYKTANDARLSVNTRNFSLLGDPVVTLAYPKEQAVITKINNVAVSAVPDTIGALGFVTISGMVTDTMGNILSSFNGQLNQTVFDKEMPVTTLANDPGSLPFTFLARRSIIHKGTSSVVNGEFSFQFIVPIDIAYNFGKGLVSLYVENQVVDGAGAFTDFIIGGNSGNAINDDEGPEIGLFMNDTRFVSGGVTDRNPFIHALLSDSSGINTVGNGIGRDITTIVNNDNQQSYILNDFYIAEKDNFRKGLVRYQLKNLSPGNYTIRFKAWDVLNNSNEAELDFRVEDEADIVIKNLLNYPNPFTTNTRFMFDHNQASQAFTAELKIFSMSGKLVKTFYQDFEPGGFHANSIEWDGLDEYGDLIGKGVYMYKLKIKLSNGKTADAIQKLVILR